MTRSRPAVDPRRAQDVKAAIGRHLLPWFARTRRALPWRTRRTPYRVWLSEAMLHQTRVNQALPYYRRFLKRFPSIKALAEAPMDDVLKQWEGLGYYSRARNLQKAARRIMEHHGGRFPRDYDVMQGLPGIGPYTAAAIASLAFNQDYAVVDGNVIRVLTRVLGYTGDIQRAASKNQLQAWADALLVSGRAGEFNEALMELGAMCCTPRQPRCTQCPLRRACVAYEAGTPEAYPVRRKKKRVPHKIVGAGVVVNRRGEVLIARRLEHAMLGGLWEFPGGTLEKDEALPQCVTRELSEELGIQVRIGGHLTTVRHAYSHFTIELHVYAARIAKGRPRAIHCADYAWCRIDSLRDYAFSRADLHVVALLQHKGRVPGCPP